MYRPQATRLRAALIDELGLAVDAPPSAETDGAAKRAALARAIAVTPRFGRDLRTWAYAEAVLVGDWWMCLLEEQHAVYVVDVHAYTDETRLVAHATMSICVVPGRSRGPHDAGCRRRRPVTPAPPARPSGARN
jgi:hypothetical protein